MKMTKMTKMKRVYPNGPTTTIVSHPVHTPSHPHPAATDAQEPSQTHSQTSQTRLFPKWKTKKMMKMMMMRKRANNGVPVPCVSSVGFSRQSQCHPEHRFQISAVPGSQRGTHASCRGIRSGPGWMVLLTCCLE